MKEKDLFWFSFYSLFNDGTKQAVKTKPKQGKSSFFFLFFSLFLAIYLLFKCYFVVDIGDFPENLHTVCPC